MMTVRGMGNEERRNARKRLCSSVVADVVHWNTVQQCGERVSVGESGENTRDGEKFPEVPKDDKRSGVGELEWWLRLKYYGKIVRMGEADL